MPTEGLIILLQTADFSYFYKHITVVYLKIIQCSISVICQCLKIAVRRRTQKPHYSQIGTEGLESIPAHLLCNLRQITSLSEPTVNHM